MQAHGQERTLTRRLTDTELALDSLLVPLPVVTLDLLVVLQRLDKL